jgi:hypothetical protein
LLCSETEAACQRPQALAALSDALGDLSREIANAVSAIDGQRK